jgi:phage major head subunit gpT-like protein
MALDTAAAQAKLRSLTVKFDNMVKATTPVYSKLCTTVQSDGSDEEYGMLGSVPAIREWLGDREFHSVRAARFTIENKLWESSVSIPKTALRDDRLGLYDTLVEGLAVRAARHPDKLLLSDLIVNAESQVCLDGQFFYDTDHTWGDSGSQSNDIGASAAAPAAPTVSEFNAALSAAIQAMLNFKDDHGELLHDDAVMDMTNGMQLVALVPLKYLEAARKATTVGLQINNGETHVPVVTAEVIGTPHLTGNKFDLYRTDQPVKPFIFQAREPLTRRTKGLEDIEWKDVKMMTEARYNVGYGAWWNAVRVTFS